ncbi:MAG: 4-hydroxy-3-methylbut-2-enyl diphosphate reductase [Candidatus Micrarchaeota archaeon]|nr:4-hydroxy-3-methylbut-2-enyl diphosphate reductase [Candidatus Micrarchaeota archaeon]
MIERVLLIGPRGFCAGVDRAINTVEESLKVFGAPVYVKHEIVHNKIVCDALRDKGAIFVEEVSEIPESSICVFSAHGIAPAVREQAKAKNLYTIDATCPLVTKIHIELNRFAREGKEIIYIGHRGHPEAIGVMGVRPDITQLVDNPGEVEHLQVKNPDNLVYLTQTTLSIDECMATISALKKRFPKISSPPSEDICYATTNRQTAIKSAAKKCDIILVVGSKNSSNSNRLVETSKKLGVDSYLLDTAEELKEEWFEGKKCLGISAGASAPEHIVMEIADSFKQRGAKVENYIVLDEHMKFMMPRELTIKQEAAK